MLTGVFFVIINYFWYYLDASSTPSSWQNTNRENFSSSDIEIIGNVWVAISTNIGTRYTQIKQTPVTTFEDVVDIGYILWNNRIAKDKLITTNMNFLSEYFNILKTDIRWLLARSNDRAFALDSFIAQLEYRYRLWVGNAQKLTNQKNELIQAINQSNTNIEDLKLKIGSDFSNFNNIQTLENIDIYLDMKTESTNALTYIVFINKFLNYYAILNDYNKKVLDTLINNKEILIKNTQVVIPDTGWELLRQLKLLYTEDEWKGR